MSRSSIVGIWIAAGAAIAIVFGSLAYSANESSDDAISSHIHRDLIPPFRG
jgi:hypothetical protein